MKPILLIYPPYEGRFFLKSRAPFPTGLVYIASYLRKKGIGAEIIDFSYPSVKVHATKPVVLGNVPGGYWRYGCSDSNIMVVLKDLLPDFHNVIGISSLMSSNYIGAYNVIRMIKQMDPTKKVVIGGPHATVFPSHVLKYSLADFVCVGEGEESFYQFLKGNHKFDTDISFIKDMDSLPFPDPSLIRNRDVDSYKEMVVTFSRGCPHRCSFCGSYLIQGRLWRHKSVDTVIEELSNYSKNYGIKRFLVEDDNLCPGKKGIKWLKTVCLRIIKDLPGLKFSVPHGIPVYATADKELCDLLYSAGFRNMVFPLESSDPEVLKDMNKEFTPGNWRTAIKNWSQYESKFPTEIIIGYPFVETIQTMLKTMIDVADMGGTIWASHFRLNKRTPLFDRCVEVGYISDSFDPILTQEFSISTERFSIRDCKDLIKLARGINYGTEIGINPFRDYSYRRNSSFIVDIPDKLDAGDVVARGSFGYRKGQDTLVALLIALKHNMGSMPLVSFKGKDKIVYKGVTASRVYKELAKMKIELKRTKLDLGRNGSGNR